MELIVGRSLNTLSNTHPFKDIFAGNVFQNDDTSRIRTDNEIILGSSSQPEGHDGPDSTEHLHSQDGVDFARVGVWSQKLQHLAPCHHDLLLFGAGEAAMDGVGAARRPLEGKVVQEHGAAV